MAKPDLGRTLKVAAAFAIAFFVIEDVTIIVAEAQDGNYWSAGYRIGLALVGGIVFAIVGRRVKRAYDEEMADSSRYQGVTIADLPRCEQHGTILDPGLEECIVCWRSMVDEALQRSDLPFHNARNARRGSS